MVAVAGIEPTTSQPRATGTTLESLRAFFERLRTQSSKIELQPNRQRTPVLLVLLIQHENKKQKQSHHYLSFKSKSTFNRKNVALQAKHYDCNKNIPMNLCVSF